MENFLSSCLKLFGTLLWLGGLGFMYMWKGLLGVLIYIFTFVIITPTYPFIAWYIFGKFPIADFVILILCIICLIGDIVYLNFTIKKNIE